MRGQIQHVRGKEMVVVVIVMGDTTYTKVDLAGFEPVHVYGLHVCFVCYEGYREVDERADGDGREVRMITEWITRPS